MVLKSKVAKVVSPLEEIPGVGPSLAADLESLGIKQVAQLRGKDPQQLFDQLCVKTNSKQDRCVLYVFRCAVYYASNSRHDAEKLKWWNWKDAQK
jgi:Pathogenicity locus